VPTIWKISDRSLLSIIALSKKGMKKMKSKKDELHELADKVLKRMKATGDFYDAYQDGFGEFVGYSLGAVRGDFESQVEDMRDHSEPDEQDWACLFGKIPNERHNLLISQPAMVKIDELRIWIESHEMEAYHWFCSAAVISLTNDDDGPVVVVGTMGDNTEPEIFFVSNSSEEAEKTWGEAWI
jgi:hypothetical protein